MKKGKRGTNRKRTGIELKFKCRIYLSEYALLKLAKKLFHMKRKPAKRQWLKFLKPDLIITIIREIIKTMF